jgi:hypothetical protein|tara:strand:+ start:26865 stop:27056 length:192 start_codon:yes stop_codon:yes gene_type:complete
MSARLFPSRGDSMSRVLKITGFDSTATDFIAEVSMEKLEEEGITNDPFFHLAVEFERIDVQKR